MIVSQIERHAARPRHAYQTDGLLDMVFGVALLGIALINYASIRSIATMHGPDFYLSQAYKDANTFNLAAIFIANGLTVAGFLAIEPLKRRFVYPRLGYVRPRVVPQNQQKSLVLIVFMAAAPLLFVLWPSLRGPHFWSSDMSLIAIGFGAAAGLVINFRKVGHVRHLIVAGIAVVASLILASASLDWLHGGFYLALILGVSLIASGASAFAMLLRLPALSEQDL